MQNPPAQNFPPVFLWEGMCLLRLFNMQARGTGKMECVPPADSATPCRSASPIPRGHFFSEKYSISFITNNNKVNYN